MELRVSELILLLCKLYVFVYCLILINIGIIYYLFINIDINCNDVIIGMVRFNVYVVIGLELDKFGE